MRYLVLAAMTAAICLCVGTATAAAVDLPPTIDTSQTVADDGVDDGGVTDAATVYVDGVAYPAGCRQVDVYTSQKSVLFHVLVYRFHQIKYWCWRAGVITTERHAWQFDGSSTACFDRAYPPNAWYYTWWRGLSNSGHFSEERAHVTNCVFHIGSWKEFYPDVQIWAHADGSYTYATAN